MKEEFEIRNEIAVRAYHQELAEIEIKLANAENCAENCKDEELIKKLKEEHYQIRVRLEYVLAEMTYGF